MYLTKNVIGVFLAALLMMGLAPMATADEMAPALDAIGPGVTLMVRRYK